MDCLWHGFDEIIDTRSPKEYTEDCIPGAVNLPVLSDDERALVGTIYKQSPFAARRRGAGLLAANLAAHLQMRLAERPPQWRPLVYCWRGGQRSGAMVDVLRRIGWPAEQLTGGYKYYRRAVMEGLAEMAPCKRWVVLAGKTGVGKTRLLQALQELGGAVLDLEALANHRGSVFGGRGAQPSQRKFESELFAALCALPSDQPIFIEAESRKIGVLHMPQPLLSAMRAAPLITVEAALSERVAQIIDEYHAMGEDDVFALAMASLSAYTGRRRLEQWRQWQQEQAWELLVTDLLVSFYDVGYAKSLAANYDEAAVCVRVKPTDADSVRATAQYILAQSAAVFERRKN